MNLLHLITQASTYLAASFDGIVAWLAASPDYPADLYEGDGFDYLPSYETAVEVPSLHAELEAYDSLAWKLHVHPSAFTPEDSRAMRDLAATLNIRPTDERI